MSATALTLTAVFGPETRFDLPSLSLTLPPFRATEETELDLLRRRLLLQSLDGQADAAINALYRRAANQAAALAEVTEVPLLVFPLLFEELAGRLVRDFKRAKRVQARQYPVMVEAA